MKKYAKIKNNVVTNIEVFDDDSKFPSGYFDVTDTFCDIGSLIINQKVINKPSKWHTVNHDNTGWIITPEDQITKDTYDTAAGELIAKDTVKKDLPIFSLTLDKVDSYVDTNVTNIASARTILKQIIKLILA